MESGNIRSNSSSSQQKKYKHAGERHGKTFHLLQSIKFGFCHGPVVFILERLCSRFIWPRLYGESDTIFNILLVRSFPYLFTNHLWFSGFCVSFNLGVVFAITKYYPDENLILFNTAFSLQFLCLHKLIRLQGIIIGDPGYGLFGDLEMSVDVFIKTFRIFWLE